jgi:hypothetical protein
MSAKSAFLSATPSKFALPPVYGDSVGSDITGIVSNTPNSTALVISAPPAGRYIVSYSVYTTGTLTGVSVDVSSTADTASLDLIAGTTMTGYRSSGCVLLTCNGINDVVFTVNATTSAGTWTIKQASYVEMVSIC